MTWRGRLMCCLRYEDETYEELRKKLPKRNTRVKTEKAASILKFTAQKSMADTVREIATQVVAIPASDLNHRRYYNIKQMEHLM